MKKLKNFPAISISVTGTPPTPTGTWRRRTPVHQERLSPCTDLCPCAGNIPTWMDLIAKGNLDAAWRELTDENPFPLITGRVCYRFCEQECNRKGFDDRVSVGAVERFLGEYAIKHHLHPSAQLNQLMTPVTVAVIGGGPAGLSAAHFLARAGCDVTIFDENEELGGLLRYGIPAYRLPKKLLEQEISSMVIELGGKAQMRARVDRDALLRACEKFDHVVVALGAHKTRALFHVREEENLLNSGLDFLSMVSSGRVDGLKVEHAEHVCVIGGGNTAIDVARSVLRLGQKSGTKVTIMYRRSEEEMPAHKDEIAVAKREGVRFVFLTSPRHIIRREDGKRELRCVRMILGESDESGRRRVEEADGVEFTITCDLAFSAIGESSDVAAIISETALPHSEEDVYLEKVVCAGDALYGPRSVSEAIASGKEAAKAIIRRVTGVHHDVASKDVVREQEIKFHYLAKLRANPNIFLEHQLTQKGFRDFAETTRTMTREMAEKEAARCINCGTCIACNRCFDFCPDVSIIKMADNSYTINTDMCKGCGLCADVCERGVIVFDDMEEVNDD
ncbi:MAG: Iron-sulfur-binding protein, glutamate synthase DsrL/GltD [Parcubacteria group bacterium GW2011_GWA2_47_7]|nr:MAG: Iron-sulfur-binding protein, glutamate synthase DsrL/GltD [Parcubacteria group bacterium GW2011_GWA2_47_7]